MLFLGDSEINETSYELEKNELIFIYKKHKSRIQLCKFKIILNGEDCETKLFKISVKLTF